MRHSLIRMRAFLDGQHGNFPIPAGKNLLGRGQDCALRIHDSRLSRHHARLLFDGTELIIEDLGSTNGVLVNGERIAQPRRLKPQDTVVCGPCVFTVVVDPTQKAFASDFLPATDRRPDPHDTEAMDPLNLPGTDKAPSPPNRHINSLIAAALDSNPGRRAEPTDVSSDILRPDEQSKVQTDALVHHSNTPKKNEISPQATRTNDGPGNTTGLVPADFKPTEDAALQPDLVAGSRGGKAPAWKRGVAGTADLFSLALITVTTGLPILVAGYAWALVQAGAVIDQGLPQLTGTPGNGASGIELAKSLMHDGGVTHAVELSQRLMRASDQQPFMTLFATSSVALLIMMVCAILYLIGSTVVRGAPFWHRRMGLEIVEHRTGYLLTWTRAVVRWLLFLLLWPLAPITLGIDLRSLHDVLSGCAVRGKRSVTETKL
jgi:hypothetical protein